MNPIDNFLQKKIIPKTGINNFVLIFILVFCVLGSLVLLTTDASIYAVTIQASIIAFGGGILIQNTLFYNKLLEAKK